MEKIPQSVPELSAEKSAEKRELRHIDALDSVVREQTSRTLAQSSRIEAECDTLSSTEKKEGVERVKRKTRNFVKRFLRSLQFVTFAAATGFAHEIVQYESSRYTVEQKVSVDGNSRYVHEDPQTTAILEHLSGRTELPRELKLSLTKKLLEDMWHKGSVSFGDVGLDDIRNGTEEEVEKILTDTFGKQEANIRWLTSLFEKPESNEALYDALWKIEQASGNPRIRFMKERSLVAKKLQQTFMRSASAMYDPSTNTMYINEPLFFANQSTEDFVSEAAHGKQWAEKPFESSLQGIRDVASTVLDTVRSGKSLNEAYGELYDTPGTVEHEAHSVIEEELKGNLPEEE